MFAIFSFFSFFFFSSYGHHRDLHSFPTRRSSDLGPARWAPASRSWACSRGSTRTCTTRFPRCTRSPPRSEEHTSELQSHSDLVCRLLLEKKKKKIENIQHDAYQPLVKMMVT